MLMKFLLFPYSIRNRIMVRPLENCIKDNYIFVEGVGKGKNDEVEGNEGSEEEEEE